MIRDREIVLFVERRKWRRRMAWAVGAALLVGGAIGYLAALA